MPPRPPGNRKDVIFSQKQYDIIRHKAAKSGNKRHFEKMLDTAANNFLYLVKRSERREG